VHIETRYIPCDNIIMALSKTYTQILILLLNIFCFVSSTNVTNTDPNVIIIYKDEDDRSQLQKDFAKGMLYVMIGLLCMCGVALLVPLIMCMHDCCDYCYCCNIRCSTLFSNIICCCYWDCCYYTIKKPAVSNRTPNIV
jgi:hypothetical protein